MKIKHFHNIYYFCLLLTAVALLFSCATSPKSKTRHGITKSSDSGYSDDKGMKIAQIAQSMVGIKYRYGGSSPDEGFDCSGLVYYSHSKIGEQVPRVSYAQLAASDEVDSDDLRPGDLLFYRINGKPSHVGIYIGQGQFVHAPSSGKKVRVSSMANVYFKPRLIRAGRLYNDEDGKE